jgi:hypothetical protein
VPMPANDVTDYRDWLLTRTRRVQRGVTVSAVVAAVGLSAAFAHTLPGHHAAARKTAATPSHLGTGQRAATAGAGRHAHSHHHHHHHPLQPPAQPPAPPPATSAASTPPVTSGGS